MSQIAILVAILFAVSYLLRLRTFLAVRFPTRSARALPVGTALPPAYADIAAEAHAELAALGFEGPFGYLVDGVPAEAVVVRFLAVYRKPDDGALFIVFPSVSVTAPNRLGAFAATRLADGRIVISQANDVYFALLSTPRVPTRAVTAATHAQLWEAHRGWVAAQGADIDPAFTEPAARLDFVGDWHNRMLDALVAEGRLSRGRDGVIRPGWRLAWSMLTGGGQRVKPLPDGKPTPPTRLAALATVMERMRHAEPPSAVQWLLFGASVVLFMIGGALFWDLQFALLLLLVIFLHELGHYAAMRAFGYRNVHMLALPLVGGVTIGQEVHPSATRRAWMSLMGPLPGIVIGWALLFLPLPSVLSFLQPHAHTAALMFLTVNYLNVLPVPPLDGGHVVQALLPPRWYVAQVLFLGVACILGAVAAWYADLQGLAVVALLQLTGVRAVLANGRALKQLLAAGVPPLSQPRVLRLARVFEVLQQVDGPPPLVQARITQAEAILRAADQTPMSWLQRGVVGSVMVALLVVPVATTAMYWTVLFGIGDTTPPVKDLEARAQRYQERQARLEEQVRTMAVGEVARTLTEGPVQAASADAIAAAAQRLEVELPDELIAVYRESDGLKEFGLVPLARLQWLDTARLAPLLDDGQLDVMKARPGGGDTVRLSPDRIRRWLRIGGEDDGADGWYYDLASAPAIPGHRVVQIADSVALAHSDLASALREEWVTRRALEQGLAETDAQAAQLRAQLEHADLDALLAAFPEPGWIARWAFHAPSWPAPADDAGIAEAGRRLGVELPGDLVALYRQHDGFPPLQMLPVSATLRVRDWLAVGSPSRDTWNEVLKSGADIPTRAGQRPRTTWSAAEVEDCVVIGAYAQASPPAVDAAAAGAVERGLPILLWCPVTADRPTRVVDVRRSMEFPDFHSAMVDFAAVRRVAGGG